MFLNKCVFVFTCIWYILFGLVQCLVTLPKVEDNNIITTESVIRTTVNSLFTNLGIKKVRDKPRLKQYSVAHNYFVSLTLQDYNSLKEIAKLTRVVKSNLSDVTNDYITLINEILDEDNVHKLQSIILGEHVTPEYDIESEKVKFESLNKYHAELKNKYADINGEVLKILLQDGSLELNGTTADDKNIEDSNENVLDDLPIWHEDKQLTSGRRLYNAKQTKIKHFPFMASVQIFNKFQCGGSIIKSDLVITSASCLQLAWNNRFYRENPAFLSVRVGTSFYEIGGERIGVMEVYFHPSYNPKNLHNNLALMRLVRMIKMHKKKGKVKKILLDEEDSSLPLNVMGVQILGWGAHSTSNRLYGPWEDKLRQVTLSVYPLDDCQDVYSKEYVTKNNFCAGTVSVGSGACNRDVGGPGIVSGKLVGIISFGAPACGTPDAPTVFTKVGFYYDWIEEIMDQDVPHIRQRTTSLPPTFPYAPPDFYSPPHKWSLLPIITTEVPNITDISLKEMDDKLFKEFLRTIFKSAEIEEYFDSTKPSMEPVTQPIIEIETVQQPTMNKSEVLQLITDWPKNGPQNLPNQDLVAPNTIEIKEPMVFPNKEESKSSSTSEEIVPNHSTVLTSLQPELDSTKPDIKPALVPELVMDYSTDSSIEINQPESNLRINNIQPDQILSTRSPDSLQTSEETLNSPSTLHIDNAVNEKIDSALLALMYVSDNEKERMGQQLGKSKIFDKEERKNNPETFVDPVPFKDLTYRLTDQDNIHNLRKLWNNDMIVDFIKEEIMANISNPLLGLNILALEPSKVPVAETTPPATILEPKSNSTLRASV